MLRTAIWLPLLLWLLLRMVAEPPRWRWWMATGVTVAVAFLAGHSQTFLYVVYTAAAWAILLFVLRWRSLAARARGILAAAFLASGLLALGLSAAQLLPSVEFAGLSVRANVDYAFVAGGFPLQDTWQLLLPAVLTQYSPLYIGVIGLGFAWLGIWFVFSRRSQASTGALDAFAACRRRVLSGSGSAGPAARLRRQRLALSGLLSVCARLESLSRPGTCRLPGCAWVERAGRLWCGWPAR